MNLCKFGGALVNDPINFGRNENDYIVRVKLLVKSSYMDDGEKYMRKDYAEVVGFDNIGKDILLKYKKGDYLSVDARIQNRVYTDRSGSKVYKDDYVIEKINSDDKLVKES